jgi:hypothetical protein
MVLPHDEVAERVALDEDGYRGVIVPAERGAIAVLAQDSMDVDVDAVVSAALVSIAYVD